MHSTSIAIIGAGASGIGVGKALRQAGIEDFEIIEATARFGGNWQPDGPASKMYDSVHLISSRRNTQFADFPMPRDYPDYPRHTLVFDYLERLAAAHGLDRKTRFNTAVAGMRRSPGGWTLRFQDGGEAEYGLVVVCNGLLRRPLIPAYRGSFSGRMLHAADYKSADLFRGKSVLVVGGGNSGCDIAVDAAQAAGRAFHSTRRGYYYMPKFIDGRPTQEWLMEQAPKFPDPDQYWAHVQRTFKLAGYSGPDYGLPEPDHAIHECHPIMNSQILYYIGHGDVTPKPDVERFDGGTVHFTDGSAEAVDVVVWATGYDIDLPFLMPDAFDWRREFGSLFLRMVPQACDDLLFVGYLNTPSGIGNLANMMGRFAATYARARRHRTPAWDTFQQMKRQPSLVDLGQQRFMTTARHQFEVDLWKFIKALNFTTAKLGEGLPELVPA